MRSPIRTFILFRPIVCTLFGLATAPALAGFTQVEESPSTEFGHREILSGIYGGEFVGSGTDLGKGLFTVFSNGTVTAERIDDFDIGTVLNLLSGGPGTGDDILWQDGIAVAAAKARYAAFPQEFGYDAGPGFVKLFEITGDGFAVSGEGMVNFGMDTIWAWARANGSDGTLVNDQYSLETMNGDGLDHMVTYRITGIADVPSEQTVWLLFWEDLNGPLGAKPDNQPFPSDRDFNDLVIEVTAFECNEDNHCTDPDRPLCDTSRGVCVECLEDRDCSDDGVCEPDTGICRECLEDADCDDGDPATVDTCNNLACSNTLPATCLAPSLALADTVLTLVPADIDLRQDGLGPVTTKARFTIWNQNEVRFSGTSRCITCSDQTLLSQYGFPNHFLVENLQTDKGKARIEGLSSNVCEDNPGRCDAFRLCVSERGPAAFFACRHEYFDAFGLDFDCSTDTPLLGVAVKEIRCSFGEAVMRTAATPIGTGFEDAQIRYDIIEPPAELIGNMAGSSLHRTPLARPAPARVERQEHQNGAVGAELVAAKPGRTSTTKKGSVLFWPKVEIKWDVNGRLVQDTFIELTNDFQDDVLVQLFFINGDPPLDPVFAGAPPVVIERGHPGWNHTGAQIILTANESTFWSVLTGQPEGFAPLSILDSGDPPGRPDLDGGDPGARVLRGFIVGFAVNTKGHEIRWNHLTGGAMIVNYDDTTASQYRPWAFQCVSDATTGEECDGIPGQLNMDGDEFDVCPAKLLLDFYATGTAALSAKEKP